MIDETRHRHAALACFASALLGAALLPSFTHTQSKVLRWSGPALTVLLVLEGFFFVTVVWVAIGFVVAVPAELVLGLLFFRYARNHDVPLRANAIA